MIRSGFYKKTSASVIDASFTQKNAKIIHLHTEGEGEGESSLP
jgi:hypothetical protein